MRAKKMRNISPSPKMRTINYGYIAQKLSVWSAVEYDP